MHVFPWYSKLVLSVYDTREKWVFNPETGQQQRNETYLKGTNVPVSFMLGGYTLREGTVKFDWNFTLTRNRTEPFRRIGLLALHNYDAKIWQLSVHEKFAIRAHAGIEEDQKGFLVARNDYHSIRVPISLVVTGTGLAGWAIALIVIGTLLAAGVAGYIVFIVCIKKKSPNRESQTEKSLLEREGELDQKDEDDDDSEQEG